MKATGVIRKVDELGRIVIPKEIRRVYDIKERDPIEIFVNDGEIILKKYEPGNACAVTGEVSQDNMTLSNGKIILSKKGMEMLLEEISSITEPV